jgi:hypothetical protein
MRKLWAGTLSSIKARYFEMSTITISLSDERILRLRELAKEAKLAPEELIQASIEEWLSRPKEDFARAANYVLQKNAELYRRLA